MCWNKEVSIITFVLAMIGSYYLFQRNAVNDRWVSIFAATIALIQLAEYFLWTDQSSQSSGQTNRLASMFVLLILAAEPLMNMLGGIYFSNTPYKSVLKWMLLAYVIFILFTFFTQVYQKNLDWRGVAGCDPDPNPFAGFFNGKECNLQWNFTKEIDYRLGIIWVMFLMIPFLTMTEKQHGIILFALGLITAFMAKSANNAAAGSLWCWLAISLIVVKIFILK